MTYTHIKKRIVIWELSRQRATVTHTDIQPILTRTIAIQRVKAKGGQVTHLITGVVSLSGSGGGGIVGDGAADGGGAGVATVASAVVAAGGVAGATACSCNATMFS